MTLTQVNQLASPVAESKRDALLSLLSMLDEMGYSFVTATPSTHARVVARPTRQRAESVRDVLGWSLPFDRDLLPSALLDRLRAAEVVQEEGRLLRSAIRVSSVRGTLFIHSAYPTDSPDSVFLGPDSYRFAELILARMGALPPGASVLDYGAGAGVGGIVAARNAAGSVLTLADINPKALFLSSINATHGGVDHRPVEATTPRDVPGSFDLIVTHPPFMIDRGRRAYRDGGDLYGGQLSLEWVLAGIEKLKPGGRLILHTGVSIVAGRDVLHEALRERLPAMGLEIDYRELDPDIFGEELDQQQYADVERIAAVGLVIRRTGDL
jgi:methylase of polypeptide subunit release factors